MGLPIASAMRWEAVSFFAEGSSVVMNTRLAAGAPARSPNVALGDELVVEILGRRLPAVETRADHRTSATAELLAGIRLLGRGIGMYARTPRLLVLGLIPAVISAAIMTAAFAVLIYFVSDLAALVTWFADDWSASLRGGVRVLAGVAIVGIAAVLAVLTYTAITLVIGDPFYEAISKKVEERYGAVPEEVDVPWWRSMRWNLVDSLRLLALTLAIGIPMFVLGFIPLVGQTVVPVLDALIGGWFLVVELTGIPFNRRGLRLRDRRRLLAANRALALGFGVPVFLIVLVRVVVEQRVGVQQRDPLAAQPDVPLLLDIGGPQRDDPGAVARPPAPARRQPGVEDLGDAVGGELGLDWVGQPDGNLRVPPVYRGLVRHPPVPEAGLLRLRRPVPGW